ncbi:ABC transporter permease [Dysgonomonas sp. Marseille-P4361]|uniref:ABC transporter permease n=1 Tax=Dysgonomonas sp. Marseille-P4361 TaxID=2161820 RepID=UPI000D550222|nr:ABC transporter permease [Dysgonomonas sp. Marseille-P4361]
MKKLLLDIYYVWINELKVVFKDEAVILLFFIVPMAYPVLYSFIYNNETAHEVKVVMVDDSNSSLSREFKRKVDATADVNIIGYATDMEEAREALRRKEAYGIMYIPRDFSKKIHTQQQTSVSVYADMSSLLFYKAMLLSATEVSLDMGADIRVAEMGGGSQEQDATTRQTVESEWVTLYNPQNGFASFLVPAILILIIQQTLLLGICTIIGTHNDQKRFTIASHTAKGRKVNAVKLTMGKAFCYASLYMVICVWVLRVVPYLFKFPQIGDPLTIAAFLMPFLLSATFFAMTLSYFCSQREFGMLLFVFTSVIFIFMSGISWPWTSIPDPLKAIAYIIPSTPGIHGFVKINTMGATLPDVWPEYITLWIETGIYCITATLMYRWWIQNYDPEYKGMLRKRSISK